MINFLHTLLYLSTFRYAKLKGWPLLFKLLYLLEHPVEISYAKVNQNMFWRYQNTTPTIEIIWSMAYQKQIIYKHTKSDGHLFR